MSTYSLVIKSGEFSQVYGESCQIISPTEAKVGDWNCTINNKQLTCFLEKSFNGQTIKLKYVIFKNGFSRLVLKRPGQSPKVLKEHWLSRPGHFNLNGVLSLPCDDTPKRKPYFYTKWQKQATINYIVACF